MVLEQKNNNSSISEEKGTVLSRTNKMKTQTLSKKKALRPHVGDVCSLKISALAPNNVGIDEYSFAFAVFVPLSGIEGNLSNSVEVGIGSEIKAKIVKIQDSAYAVGEFIEEKVSKDMSISLPVKPGDVLTVSLKKMTESVVDGASSKAGIVEISKNYNLIVPLSTNTVLENVKVIVTRVKSGYAFGKLVQSKFNKGTSSEKLNNIFEVGSKFTTTLSKENLVDLFAISNSSNEVKQKVNSKYIVLKIKGSILFVKNGTVLPKEIVESNNNKVRVRIKITSKSENCAVGKILQFNPISSSKKSALVLKNIREMINHGMHFGEKAVKCHARMKNYIWLTTKDRPLIKKGRHVINLLKTRRCLNQALNKLTKLALKGRTFLFIGTKKPAAGLVARASFFTKNSFYVNTRWLGGMLTNWKTICKSISKIRPILKEKQKVVREILERRQAIKTRLIKKALLLRKKSKVILNKGRLLLEILRKDKSSYLNQAKQLTTLRNDFINKGMLFVEKRQQLIQKRRELILQAQTLLLKEKGLELSLKHKNALNQLAIYAKKLREYKYLLILTSEIQKIKQASTAGTSNQQINLVSVSYGKLKNLLATGINKSAATSDVNSIGAAILPNPPKEILNKMVLTCLQSSPSSTISLNKDGASISSDSQQKQFIVCSTLLSKFSNFSSYIKSVIKTLIKSIKTLENQVQTYSVQLKQIQTTLQTYLNLKQKYVTELQQLISKFTKERAIIRIVKRKLKAFDSQKKLLKFLPRLRYLPTPQTKISEIVQILLSKIVDPKLKYPIENIYDQKLNSSSLAGGSKKLAAARKKKWQRLEKYFGGIANMTKLTKAQIEKNVAIIIGQKEEINAVRECQKLGIKMFTIVDTNCNPTLCEHIIPANDDSRSSIKYILTKFITRIRLAQKLRSRLSRYSNTIYIKK